MAKDNITYPSLITLNKIFTSNINKDIVDESMISNSLVFESPIGIEDIPPLYVAEYQVVYNAFTIKPDNTIAEAQNAMVQGMVDSGVWAKKDVFYVFAAHTNDNGEALINWINPGTFDAVLVNNPAFVAFEGFTGDGATQYINTNYNASISGVNYLLNDASISVYNRIDVDELRAIIGTQSGSNVSLLVLRTTNLVRAAINRNIQNTSANTNALGMYILTRPDSASHNVYKNKINIDAPASPSVAIPNNDFYLLARNLNGSPDVFSTNQISYAALGSDTTQTNVADETDYFETYMDSNGKGVII